MGKRDPRVDAYIAESADFARPILLHLREVVHAACPEVEETMKWSFPHFDYKGMLCSMASFKQHCAFGFWKASLILEGGGGAAEQAMGSFGRITSLADLPADDVLTGYIHTAVRLNDEGTKAVRNKTTERKPRQLEAPDYFLAALGASPGAQATYERFSPSQKREYVEWVTEAKTEATRQRRLQTAVEWMAEGKTRHWKYQS